MGESEAETGSEENRRVLEVRSGIRSGIQSESVVREVPVARAQEGLKGRVVEKE